MSLVSELVTVHANTNHLLIGVEKASKSGKESAPPLEAVFKWADSVTVRGYPVNSNTKITGTKEEEN